MLVCVGLSGCNQSNNKITNNPYSNYVEISNIKVTTVWNAYTIYGSDGHHDGFYHDFPSKDVYATYQVSGTIKNIASKPIDSVTLVVNFYDDKGNFITSQNSGASFLYLGDSQTFSVSIVAGGTYNEHISDYKIEVTNVIFHE